jgi:hypothetical protein
VAETVAGGEPLGVRLLGGLVEGVPLRVAAPTGLLLSEGVAAVDAEMLGGGEPEGEAVPGGETLGVAEAEV